MMPVVFPDRLDHRHGVSPFEGQPEFCGAGWSGTRETGDRAVRRERRSVSLRLRVPNREHSSLLAPVRGPSVKDDIEDVPAPTGAIDWASEKHVGAVVDHTGRLVARYEFAHTAAGLASMLRRLTSHGVARVAIERPDGPVVEALLDGGFVVFVIHPRQMKNLRGRYGNAGNKDDALDAFVLADVLRTDHRRLRPLERDTDPTRALRALTRARKDLVEARVALTNQLLANLQLALPGAIGLFHDLDSPISLAWLRRFTTQSQADWLSPRRFDAWLRGQGYCGRKTGQQLHDHLAAAPHGLFGVEADARAVVTLALIDSISHLNGRITVLERQIREQLELHPDAHIFTSLPKGGIVRAATLLAEIGDARGRFPTDDALAALAGVAPSTRRSGKLHAVTFRFACDKKLRDAIINFADDSRHASPWAADIYARARARKLRHPHAVRILARAWIRIIWRCWQDGVAYDPDRHGGHQRLLMTTAA
jgi:transposase